MRQFWLSFVILSALLLLATAKFSEAKPLVKVAVIDSGLDITDARFTPILCKEGHKDFTGTGLKDAIGHGTHVAGLIKKYAGEASGYCIVVLKYYSPLDSPLKSMKRESEAIEYAKSIKANIVNISGGGVGFDEDEYLAILRSQKQLFIVSAGNDNKNLNNVRFYPASYPMKNIIVVGALDKDGHKSIHSNFGPKVTSWELGDNVLSTTPSGEGYDSGTSMAAAIHTGKLVHSLVSSK